MSVWVSYQSGLQNRQSDDAARVRQMVGDTRAYYMLLSDRLEKILSDMDDSGTSPDSALKNHFARLLDETRDLLRKGQSGPGR